MTSLTGSIYPLSLSSVWWVTLWFPPLLCTKTLVSAVIQRSGTKLTFKTDQEERIKVLLRSEDLCGSPGAAQEILNRSSTLMQEAARIVSSLHSDLKHRHSSFTRTRWLATHIKSRPAGPLFSLRWVMELIKQTLPRPLKSNLLLAAVKSEPNLLYLICSTQREHVEGQRTAVSIYYPPKHPEDKIVSQHKWAAEATKSAKVINGRIIKWKAGMEVI